MAWRCSTGGSREADMAGLVKRRHQSEKASSGHRQRCSALPKKLGVRQSLPAAMKVILFGATGMIGAGVLRECLRDDRVSEIVSVQRSLSGTNHPKLRVIVRSDFFDYRDARDDFRGADACFFCLGATAVGKSEAEYHRVTLT